MLYEITSRRYRVCAVMFEQDFKFACPVWDFMKAQHPTIPGSVSGLKGLFERYADSGRAKLSTEVFHHADQKEEIFEFIKGQIRIFCFLDGNAAILTNGALKKTPKASSSDVGEAIRCRNLYQKWKGNQ